MQRNFIKQCKVCGSKEKVCFHYGVCTCRACGAFFRYFLLKFNLEKFLFKRRFIENEGECKYKCKCSKENKNGKSETNLAKCKKCRLDKCLSVGMRKSGSLRYGNATSPKHSPRSVYRLRYLSLPGKTTYPTLSTTQNTRARNLKQPGPGKPIPGFITVSLKNPGNGPGNRETGQGPGPVPSSTEYPS